MSCRFAASHAAGQKARKFGGHGLPWAFFASREGAKARRRQEEAACLAAARQVTPPGRRREGANVL